MGKTLKPLIIGIIIGVVGLYAYQNPDVRSQVSEFVGGILNSVSEAPAPPPTAPPMAALPAPTATPTQVAPIQVSPVPTATPLPSPTNIPKSEPSPTITATRVPIPSPTPASYSINVISVETVADGQVDFFLEVRNESGMAREEVAQVQMSVDGGAPELVNIIANLPPGESASFAFARTLAPGPHAIRFSVGDSHTAVSVNVEAGDVTISTPTPQPTATAIPTMVPTPMPTNTPMPTITPLPTNTAVPTNTPTLIPTQTPVPPPIVPTNTLTPKPESLADRFFKSAKDLTETSRQDQPEINIGELETLVHSLINQERLKRDLAGLEWDGEIAAIARDHSVDMGNKKYFSHTNRDGQNATDRGANAGYDCIKDYGNYYTFGLAENIHQGWLFSSTTYINGVAFYNWSSQGEIAARAVNGWMESRGHRENILKDTYDRTGIGIAITSEGKVFITQNFC